MKKLVRSCLRSLRRDPKKPPNDPNPQTPAQNSENVFLVIFNHNGLISHEEYPRTSTWQDVKIRAVREFFERSSSRSVIKLSKHHSLVNLKTGTVMDEKKTLNSFDLTDNDEYLLKEHIHCSDTTLPNVVGPSMQTINEVTMTPNAVKEETIHAIPVISADDYLMENVDTELREIIKSCAKLSAYMVGAGPYAKRLIAFAKQRVLNQRRCETDMAKRLTDMGFRRCLVKHSLKLNNNVYPRALDWLIQNQNTSSISSDDVSNSSSIEIAALRTISNSAIQNGNDETAGNINATTNLNNVHELLHIVDIYSRVQVPPDEVVKAICSMGFAKPDVLHALTKTGNCAPSACIWLCGDRSEELTNLQSIITPIMQSLLKSAEFNRCLSDPYIFMTYLTILENTMEPYASLIDETVSEHFGQILNAYLINKRYKIINEFNS